jgi:2-hydroxychromene-2-carboxylate isomerase
MSTRGSVDWFFDYISPFAYLQRHRIAEVAEVADITFRPVLFAGLLRNWEHKGPAEIPGKRVLTFRHAHWLAEKMGVPYRMPDSHPFNPIKALRLTIALGCTVEVINTIFDAIWVDGLLPENEADWKEILNRLSVENGALALKNELFGVPTFVANGHLFWGLDTTDMLLDYLSNPSFFEDPEMKRILYTKPSTTRRV